MSDRQPIPTAVIDAADLRAALGATDAAQRQHLLGERGQFAQILRKLERQPWPDADTLAEVWRWALWLMGVRGLPRDSTVARYAGHVGALVTWLCANGHDWRTCGRDPLEAWLRWLYLHRQQAARTRAVAVGAARGFYEWRASHRGGIHCGLGLRSPKIPKRVPRRYTPADLRALFDAVRRYDGPELARLRDRALLLFLLATGARASEVADLVPDQIDVQGRVASVRIYGKGAKERTVSLEGPAVHALTAWLVARNDDPAIVCEEVFANLHGNGAAGYGTRLNRHAVYTIIARHAAAAGIKARGAHRFRVTFATRLYDDGVDIERIRIALGHEKIETTRGYLALSDRQRSVRLSPKHQHAALGSVPDEMPLWARHEANGGLKS